MKFKDPKFKHEIFVLHHLLQSIFSVVEIIFELFGVCQKLIHVLPLHEKDACIK